MASFLDITFDAVPTVIPGEGVTIVVTDGNISYGIFEMFVDTRTANNQSAVGLSINQSATFFAQALNVDFGSSTGIDTIVLQSSDTVRITLDAGWTFVSNTAPSYVGVISFSQNNDNTPVPDQLSISTAFSERSVSPCNTINVDITISGGTAPYSTTVDGFTIADTSSSPTVPKGRGLGVFISVESSDGQTVTRSVNTPETLVAENYNVGIIQSPTGSTVTITTLAGPTSLEYSLDNVNFQSSNSFSGQATGDYTVYIRDDYGCTISIDYTISDISPEPLDPFFLYPEANMVRMYQVQTDTPGIRANYHNRQSCEEYVRGYAYQNIQFWEAEDDHYIQFKTNHDNVQLLSVDVDGNETSLAITRIVQNIGLSDGRDGKYFKVTDSTLGLYFDSGNTYDPDTQVANGTYALTSGLLPSFIVEGVFVNVIGLGFKEVLSTAYDQQRQRWYAVISGTTASTVDVQTEIYTDYNNQVYDVYATTVPMASRLNTNFKYIIRTDQIEFKSEEQRVISNVRGVVIDYFNAENRYDIVYATDNPAPRFRLRMPDMDISKLLPDSEVQNYNSDDAPVQLDNKLYRNFELRCEDLSTAMAFKVLLALTHNAVTVNGLTMTYKEVGEFEVVENTNLYMIRVIMIEGGNAAARQREDTINLTIANAIRLEADLGLINYNA